MPEVSGTKDLRSYLGMMWRWKWLFLFFVIVTPTIAYLIQRGKPTVYKSSALVGINSTTVNSALVNGAGTFSTSNLQAIARLVTTTPVEEIAAGLLKPPANPGQIGAEVSASADQSTGFLTISAEDPSPARAAAIANAFAKAISLNLQQSTTAQINASIKSLRSQLARLGPKNGASRTEVQGQIDQLVAARSTQGSQAAILQAATPSGTPAGTSTRRVVEIGLLIGVLLGFGAVVLAESADRRFRTPDDLEGATDLPLLAAIAPSAFSAELNTGREDEESFQMLRTSLMYFNVERPLDSVVITSAGEKDGKTTVAIRLALSSAAAGLDVVLIDADLRRAQATARLGIEKHGGGLGGVIAGTAELSEAMVDYPVETSTAGRLRVLAAGPPAPNPSALMSSPRMQAILRELESQSNLVIIDTPAALAVSDPLPLMRSVTGVVLVARINRSGRHAIRRLQTIVESAHGNLLGVVATGAGAGVGYGHYYPTYYATNGTNGTGDHGLLRRLRGSSKSKAAAPPEE
jgi:capsular exopolysaccharide synthesis family protein